MLLVKLSDS